jgi:transaldolase
MRLFLDTASIEDIRTVAAWGVLGGVTTNPSLLAREGDDPDAVWKTILTEVEGDVSLEVTAADAAEMESQGRALAEMGPNAIVKLPMTPAGLTAATRLGADGIRVNITLVFSPAQAILAAEAGAYCVSPFLGRLDDAGADGMGVLRTICDLYAVQGYQTQVLAASLRHPMHVVEAALAGADIATMPFDVFTKLVQHPLTDIGVERFTKDWERLQTHLRRGEPRKEG